MNAMSRYVGGIVFTAIIGVLFVIVALDFISGLIDQVGDLDEGYKLVDAAYHVLLYIPSTTVEYIPMAALVGCLIGLGALASSSELIVMRAAGISISYIVKMVFKPVLFVVLIGVLIGEFVSPYLDQYADSQRALALGHSRALERERGLWNREGSEYMHFNAVLPNGRLFGVTRYVFSDSGQLEYASFAETAIYQGEYWLEQGLELSFFEPERVRTESHTNRRWDTELSPDLLNVLVLSPDALAMKRLFNYAQYLDKQNQDSSEYWLAFWQKALQPLATLSLVIIAISFILGPLRQVTMGFRVFIGVIVGLIFQFSQRLLGPSSIIFGFAPIFAVLVPILVCFLVGWLLLKRAE